MPSDTQIGHGPRRPEQRFFFFKMGKVIERQKEVRAYQGGAVARPKVVADLLADRVPGGRAAAALGPQGLLEVLRVCTP